jgi:hypothetical protein
MPPGHIPLPHRTLHDAIIPAPYWHGVDGDDTQGRLLPLIL